MLRPLVVVVCGSAVYGAAFGAWHGPLLAFYAAVKLPAVLLVTASVAFLFNWLAGATLGAPTRPREVARLCLSAMAVSAVLLASLAPVVFLFDLSIPAPGDTARTTHNVLYLLHVALVGGCGLAGLAALWRGLRRFAGSNRVATRIMIVWLSALAIVGGEVAWAMRPFIGSIYEPVAFLRSDALDGNVYEFIWTDIRPYLLGLEESNGPTGANTETPCDP